MYRKFVKMHFKSMMQYKANTLILIFSSLLMTVGEFLSLYILFGRFESVDGWSFAETALTFGMINTIFPFVECFARGFDEFSKHVVGGDLDRMLVRPMGIYKQIFCCEIEYFKIPKIFLGIGISIYAITNLSINWTIAKIGVLLLSYICGFAVIFGVMLIAAGLCFFTTENLEFVNIITQGGKELCYYPINIYNKWITRFFTFIVPLACFNYLPLSFVMGHGDLPQTICALSPLIGIVFLLPCILFFNWSLKHYNGSGT